MRVLGNWQLGRSRTGLSLEFPEEPHGREGGKGGEVGGGMICISLCA